jgi:hypothetical protein
MAANHIKQQAPNKRFRMFDTAESAGLWFDIFNGVLLFGAFLVLVGTWGTIKTAAIKEQFSDERIAANEAETKRAVADSDAAREGTAKANERIAELSTQAEQLRKDTAVSNERAAQLKLLLEKEQSARVHDREQLSARHVSAAQQACLISKLAGFSKPVLMRSLHDDDAIQYSRALYEAFRSARVAISWDTADDWKDTPAFVRTGVFVVVRGPPNGLEPPSEAADFLKIISDCGIAASWMHSYQFPKSVTDSVVGPKIFGATPPTPDDVKWWTDGQFRHPDTVLMLVGAKPPVALESLSQP